MASRTPQPISRPSLASVLAEPAQCPPEVSDGLAAAAFRSQSRATRIANLAAFLDVPTAALTDALAIATARERDERLRHPGSAAA